MIPKGPSFLQQVESDTLFHHLRNYFHMMTNTQDLTHRVYVSTLQLQHVTMVALNPICATLVSSSIPADAERKAKGGRGKE